MKSLKLMATAAVAVLGICAACVCAGTVAVERRKAAAAPARKVAPKVHPKAAPVRKEIRADRKQVAEDRQQLAKDKAAGDKDAVAADKAKLATDRKDLHKDVQTGREKAVDARQDNQDKRIQHGITKGYLTSEEAAKLQSQQQTIAEMEAGFKTDGNLSRDEMKQLRTALNDASRDIWAEKHDTDGNQMPVVRLGKDIYAKSALTEAINGDTLTAQEARQFTRDFRSMLQLKHRLATADLTDEQRSTLQSQYDDLLNKYFEVRTPASQPSA